MGNDMVVALGQASANGATLFGLNHHAAADQRHALQWVPGETHIPGEVSLSSTLKVPQARQTFTVLGVRPTEEWGFTHGVNENKVAIGVTQWQSRLPADQAVFRGKDLVRLALERGRSAHHAVEVLTDLLEHYAPGCTEGANGYIFLIADANEAFILETAGHFWALLECGPTRVVTDAAMIHQDWQRLSPGLARHVIEKGWWQEDGSKIDFLRCLGDSAEKCKFAHKRWGHASLVLAQQQGAIDAHFLRRMLAEHFVQNRDAIPGVRPMTLAASFIVELPRSDEPVLAWVAFGTPSVSLYFPLCLAGDLPGAFVEGTSASTSIQHWTFELQKFAQGKGRALLPSALERLQTRFDQDADDFLSKAHDYTHHGKPHLVGQIATEMMHNHVELFEKECRRLLGVEESVSPRVAEAEEVLFFA
jgi:dipeptidase